MNPTPTADQALLPFSSAVTVPTGPLTARQPRRARRWDHGGRHLNNAFTTVAAVLGWRRSPHGWTRRTTADDR